MKKIICLIRPSPALIYFVNKINERSKVSLVVVESPSVKRKLIKSFKLTGISGVINAVENRLLTKFREKKYINDYNSHFGNMWRHINNIPVLKVEDINSQIVYERLRTEQPDLILDHGTSIVKSHILETSDMSLNLHWGLSPYYRGTHCTEWALINWDPCNIGVTIHELTSKIDGGDILAQKRANIKPDDTVNSINMQLTQLGAELVIRAIDKIESGGNLQFKRQDYSLGFLTLNEQWNRCLRKQIENIESNNLIGSMLKNPARKQKLPIVEA